MSVPSVREEVFDITIVGGGPTGLFGVFYAGMRHMKTKLIESLPQLGGQLTALYPEKFIYDVAGFPAVRARELVARLKDQAFAVNPDCRVCLGEQAVGLARRDDGLWELTTTAGRHLTRTVVLAAGIGAFAPNRLPNPEAAAYEGKGLLYNVPTAEMFRGARVLVIGGGDSAVDYALMLEPVAGRVTLIHRRDRFRAHDASVAKLLASRVQVRLCHELQRIHGDGRVRGATIVDNRTGATTELELDYIVAGTGFKASLGPIQGWGLELKGNQVVVSSRGETNLEGVYAAGDIAWYPGKVRLIATGFGEVATAVNNAKAYIDPGAHVFPGHSSEMRGQEERVASRA